MSTSAPPALRVLEQSVRLSQSRLWPLQQRYYEERGQRAWSEGTVPWRVTTNPLIADGYARVIAAWLKDWHAAGALDPAHPVYVFEPGAGTGRLGFLLLRRLARHLSLPPLQGVRVRYVMTDVGESNIRAWQAHPLLASLAQAGFLDFAVHDATLGAAPKLVVSGEQLAAGSIANPSIMVANYLFDSLPHDVLAGRGGELLEGLVTLRSPRDEPDSSDPGLLERLEVELDLRPVGSGTYDEPWLEERLSTYAQHLGDATFLFPIGAWRCLGHFGRLTGERLLVLAADKGESRTEELRAHPPPGFARHGSISYMVNFHLLGQLVEGRGGRWLQSPTPRSALNVCGYALATPPGGIPETEHCYHEALGRFSPLDAQRLADAVAADGRPAALDPLLALLRLCHDDPDLVLRFAEPLRELARGLSTDKADELAAALENAWAQHFPVGEGSDLAFVIATVFQRMGRLGNAAQFYARSLQLHGPSFSPLFNLGLCLADLGDTEHAAGALQKALELDPSHERARALLAELVSRSDR